MFLCISGILGRVLGDIIIIYSWRKVPEGDRGYTSLKVFPNWDHLSLNYKQLSRYDAAKLTPFAQFFANLYGVKIGPRLCSVVFSWSTA